jgi:hypothetical protein
LCRTDFEQIFKTFSIYAPHHCPKLSAFDRPHRTDSIARSVDRLSSSPNSSNFSTPHKSTRPSYLCTGKYNSLILLLIQTLFKTLCNNLSTSMFYWLLSGEKILEWDFCLKTQLQSCIFVAVSNNNFVIVLWQTHIHWKCLSIMCMLLLSLFHCSLSVCVMKVTEEIWNSPYSRGNLICRKRAQRINKITVLGCSIFLTIFLIHSTNYFSM